MPNSSTQIRPTSVSEALKMLFRKDDDFKRWAGQHANEDSKDQIQGEALTKPTQQI